jgi:hypothetical protein
METISEDAAREATALARYSPADIARHLIQWTLPPSLCIELNGILRRGEDYMLGSVAGERERVKRQGVPEPIPLLISLSVCS